ncbi:hypothetical protein SGLAD_v1c04760 [Spiroplasma gladiatoris]|uniref:Uncharacterized protein n=1 Tax=Spiroplasma gladiatoris TaxID=2143 RepID=A0A4P7AGY4_9MOLU|nr:hypothetical protein [Spiroplasma gladiatoris]QBQ07675.1 hypothetical protein SGLAD_v1c04760 [Spiroplasma gladiatoris]
MAKRYGYELGEYNLPSSIRKRIDDLVGLSLNPSTINLLTSEFSHLSEDMKENIGRYIANLLEIENAILEIHFKKIKEENAFGNSKQELIMKQRQSNLLRIQQIFANKDLENLRAIKYDNNFQPQEDLSLNKNDLKRFMVTNNSNSLSNDDKQKQKLKFLSEKKRRLELVIVEEQNKINEAKKIFEEAKKNNDILKQKNTLKIIKEANEKLLTIDIAIKKFKSVELIPWEVFLSEEELNNSEVQEIRIRETLNQNIYSPNKENKNYIKDVNKKTNKTIDVTQEIELNNFFDVDDFEEEDTIKKKIINKNQEKKDNNFKLVDSKNKLLKFSKIIIPNGENETKEVLVNENKFQNRFDKKKSKLVNEKINEKIYKEEFAMKKKFKEKQSDLNEIKEKNIDDLNKNNFLESEEKMLVNKKSENKSINNEKELNEKIKNAKKFTRLYEEKRISLEREAERRRFERDQKIIDSQIKENISKEKIIKKIKKNYKSKDKYFEKLKKEKEHLEKELANLKQKQKVEELRNIEIAKRKAMSSIEQTLKKDKFKGKNLHTILEKKWIAHNVKATLFTKEKAISVIKIIKDRELFLKNKTSEEISEWENWKKEFKDNIELILKNDRYKGKNLHTILERKWLAYNIKNTLFSKERANKIINQIKSNHINQKVPLLNDTNKLKMKKYLKFKNDELKNNLAIDINDLNKKYDFLKRKEKLNLLNKNEKSELKEIKTNKKDYSNNKINLKKFILIKKTIN